MAEGNKDVPQMSDDDKLDSFFAAATAVEPDRLSSPAQLLWRAEILERLEREDRRTENALLPILVALGAAVGILAMGLTFVFAGVDLGAPQGIAAWLLTSWIRPLVLALILALGLFSALLGVLSTTSGAIPK